VSLSLKLSTQLKIDTLILFADRTLITTGMDNILEADWVAGAGRQAGMSAAEPPIPAAGRPEATAGLVSGYAGFLLSGLTQRVTHSSP
jgi:hypothetical protein